MLEVMDGGEPRINGRLLNRECYVKLTNHRVEFIFGAAGIDD